jgi:hypothetical protein
MGRTKSEDDRIDRLASEKKGGGGLVLPLLFSALMNELIDHKTATDERLMEIVAKECENKTAKLEETWNGDWAFLTRDLMESLKARGYADQNPKGLWFVGIEFEPGMSLEVLPARPGLNAAEKFTAWDQETRRALREAAAVDQAVRDLIRQPRGKSHPQRYINELRDSYEKVGPLVPILAATVDGREVIIDGRHRREACPDWPTKILEHVKTESQVLTAILELDDYHRRNTEVLSKDAAEKVRSALGRAATQATVKHAVVERELIADASRSNNAIADITGVSDMFVGKVREKLQTDCSIHQYEAPGGRSAKNGNHSTKCWCGEGDTPPKESKVKEPKGDVNGARVYVRQKLIAGEAVGRTEPMKKFGISQGTLDRLRAEEELKLAAPPPAPVPPPTPAPVAAEPASPGHSHQWRTIRICDGCGAVADN